MCIKRELPVRVAQCRLRGVGRQAVMEPGVFMMPAVQAAEPPPRSAPLAFFGSLMASRAYETEITNRHARRARAAGTCDRGDCEPFNQIVVATP